MRDRILVGVREASYLLGISPRHLWSLSQPRGPLPVIRLGGRVLYDPDDLRRFVEQAKQKAIEQVAQDHGTEELDNG